MKYLIGIMMAVMFLIIVFLSYQLNRHYTEFDRVHVLYEGEKIAVPDYLRETTGRDSIELMFLNDGWIANFCYPNKWSPMYSGAFSISWFPLAYKNKPTTHP